MGGGEDVPTHTSLVGGSPGRENKAFRVLVTGFGAFSAGSSIFYDEDDNTSHLICNCLQATIPKSSPYNPTNSEIQIINPTAGNGKSIPASYRRVRVEHIPATWEKYGDSVDVILHLGMADGMSHYSLERGAWKEGTVRRGPGVIEGRPGQEWAGKKHYEWPKCQYYMDIDVDGETIEDLIDDEGEEHIASNVDAPTRLHPWHGGYPDKLLFTDYDIDGVTDDVNEVLDEHLNASDPSSITDSLSMPAAHEGPKWQHTHDDPHMHQYTESRNHDATIPPSASKTQDGRRPNGPSKSSQRIQLLPHSEGGPFLCGFISYETLATKLRGPPHGDHETGSQSYKAWPAFVHVPGWKDEAGLQKGAAVVYALAGALCKRIEQEERVKGVSTI